MESFTTESVSNAGAQLFSENTLSSSTIFLSEQLTLEGKREVAFSKLFYPTMCPVTTEGKLIFLL